MAAVDNRKKRRIYLFVIVAAVSIVAIYSYCVDTLQSVLAPKCFFLMLTGWKCPGCGTQRALHELVHLNIGGVWHTNPILFLAIPYMLLLVYLTYFGGERRFPRLNEAVYSSCGVMTVFYIIVAYWVLRNVFGF